MEEGGGGYATDQFHRNEVISAVVDEGFLAEEDDDYEDLYNDVNVGEGFLQSMNKKSEEAAVEKKIEPPAVAPVPGVSEGDAMVSGRVERFQSQGFRAGETMGPGGSGGSVGAGGGGGLKVALGQEKSDVSAPMGQQMMGNSNVNNNSCVNNNSSVNSVGVVQVTAPQNFLVIVSKNAGNLENEGSVRPSGGSSGNVNAGSGRGGDGGGILFVGDLHWWTTDTDLEAELCKYGSVKEVKFFEEKASGKSKGYCQVEFYDSAAAMACKEGMNGHMFNGRPCIVAFASPVGVKRMGEAQVNKNQHTAQAAIAQARRGPNEAGGKTGGSNTAIGGNHQGGENNNRGYGRGNWGRGNAQGMGNRGPMGPIRGRGGRGIIGNGFGQGIGPAPPLMHPQSMMNQGFDPAFGVPMGRMGSYGGFPGVPTPPFSGMFPSFPAMGSVGLPGVAPHVNPAFFGRGIPMNGMGMMPQTGVEGPNTPMWSDPSMGGWAGEEHGGGRAGESSYGEEGVSDHQYGDVGHDRGGGPIATKGKDRGSERDWSASSERRYRDDREPGYDKEMPREKDMGHDHDWSEKRHRYDRDIGRERNKERDRDRERSDRDKDRKRDWDRDRYKEERDRYADHHKYREREPKHDDEWDGGRSSRSHNKSRLSQEEDHRSRSRDADYGKRRRHTPE